MRGFRHVHAAEAAIFAANTILDRVCAAEETPGEETVRGHIKELRKKLKAVDAPADLIETVYRVG